MVISGRTKNGWKTESGWVGVDKKRVGGWLTFMRERKREAYRRRVEQGKKKKEKKNICVVVKDGGGSGMIVELG